jgi:hypothetical protein
LNQAQLALIGRNIFNEGVSQIVTKNTSRTKHGRYKSCVARRYGTSRATAVVLFAPALGNRFDMLELFDGVQSSRTIESRPDVASLYVVPSKHRLFIHNTSLLFS